MRANFSDQNVNLCYQTIDEFRGELSRFCAINVKTYTICRYNYYISKIKLQLHLHGHFITSHSVKLFPFFPSRSVDCLNELDQTNIKLIDFLNNTKTTKKNIEKIAVRSMGYQ